MKSRKERRHSGRVTPQTTIKNMKFSDINKQCLEPQEFWDDWQDYRDGQRNWISDGKKIKLNDNELKQAHQKLQVPALKKRLERNLKNKKLLKIRKVRKEKQ